MTPVSWGPEKGRLTSGGREREREMDGARGLNRGRCADMWVSPQVKAVCNVSTFIKN